MKLSKLFLISLFTLSSYFAIGQQFPFVFDTVLTAEGAVIVREYDYTGAPEDGIIRDTTYYEEGDTIIGLPLDGSPMGPPDTTILTAPDTVYNNILVPYPLNEGWFGTDSLLHSDHGSFYNSSWYPYGWRHNNYIGGDYIDSNGDTVTLPNNNLSSYRPQYFWHFNVSEDFGSYSWSQLVDPFELSPGQANDILDAIKKKKKKKKKKKSLETINPALVALNIFPNPASKDRVTISPLVIPSFINTAKIYVIDILGKVSFTETITSVNNGSYLLDIADLKEGTYIIRITFDDQPIMNGKLIKR